MQRIIAQIAKNAERSKQGEHQTQAETWPRWFQCLWGASCGLPDPQQLLWTWAEFDNFEFQKHHWKLHLRSSKISRRYQLLYIILEELPKKWEHSKWDLERCIWKFASPQLHLQPWGLLRQQSAPQDALLPSSVYRQNQNKSAEKDSIGKIN